MGTSNVFCREIYIAFASIVLLEVGIGATLIFVLHCPHNMVVITAQQQNTPTETASATLVCACGFLAASFCDCSILLKASSFINA